MYFLITTPSGFEGKGMEEVRQLLKARRMKAHLRTTYFKGLLLGETEVNREGLFEALQEADTDYVARVIPADGAVPAQMEGILAYFRNADLPLLGGGRFAVQCKRRGTHPFTSGEVERGVGAILKGRGLQVDLEEPEVLALVEIVQDQAFVALLPPGELIKKEPRVTRKWEPGTRPVSRAELKMREILKRFPDLFQEGFVVLDIGAAPGGWTRALAGRVKTVIAADPGELDEEVRTMPNVRYIKARGEALDLDERVDAITNDANILHLQSAALTSELVGRYLRRGGVVVHTVKLGIDPDTGVGAAKTLNEAKQEVIRELQVHGIEVIEALRLQYNTRNEVTLIGRLRDGH